MKKKLAALLLALTLCASAAGCRSQQTPAETESPTTTETAGTTEATEASQSYVFPETVLVDDENCTVIITGFEEDPLWGYTMKAYLENKTDKELMFSLDNSSINGFMCDPFWAVRVTPGMKANERIHFLTSDLERNGITSPTALSFTLNIYDSNDFTAEYLVGQVFTLYPQGENAVQEYVRTPIDGEIVLFDNEYATMIVTGTEPNDLWGFGLNVYLENKTDKNLMFSTMDVSVNGFMCDPFWATEVAAGMRSNTTISWFSETLSESGIEKVETITMPITVSDAADWLAEPLVQETVTVNP